MDLDKVRGLSMLLAAVFAVLMILMGITHKAAFGIAAIVAFIACSIVQIKFWRCPACGKGLGPLWVKYCPHCGEWLV